MVGEVLGPPLFCSDGERAENSTKQAELLGGYTAYGNANDPIVIILGRRCRASYTHKVHFCGIVIRVRPEVAMRTYPAG